MYSKPALCPQLNEQFINVQMSILSLPDTGHIMLRRYHLCHWKDIIVTDTPPPEVNLKGQLPTYICNAVY